MNHELKFSRRALFVLTSLTTACGGAAPPRAPAATPTPAAIVKAPYGDADGTPVSLYTLTNAKGFVLKVTDYGTVITELHVPDRTGKLADVVLGFDTLEGYRTKSPYFGATVGRVANRIRDAKFTLDGKEYALAANNEPHHLHGGQRGWDKAVWSAEPAEGPDGPSIRFTHTSKDGDEGYPGNVTAHTTYTLSNAGELRIDMDAVTDAPTVVNMAHHSYFNLGGHDAGPVTLHELELFADAYTPGDPLVPSGAVTPVTGTPFDFTAPKAIGKDLQAAGGSPVGFDQNFVVNGDAHALRPVARLKDPKSGRTLTLEGDQPGVQFYTGNYLDGSVRGKSGAVYAQHAGLCLETQKFPNAINVPAWRDQVILQPGVTYRHRMIFRFGAE